MARIEVGRVIFEPLDAPRRVRVQTLKNHVDNVVKLAAMWDSQSAYLSTPHSADSVKSAAEIHDMAKPQTFRLTYDKSRWSEKRQWGYSFRGHRFEAFHSDPYVESLAQLHHTFAVGEITEAMWKHTDRKEQLPVDLYVLEMCDQIEASVAASFLDKKNPDARVFMDFQIERDGTIFYLDPLPFDVDSLELEIEYFDVNVPPEKIMAVMESKEDGAREKALRALKKWLEKVINGDSTEPQYQTCTLKPFITNTTETGKIDMETAYRRLMGFDKPNPMQVAGWQLVEDSLYGVGALLKGQTGTGKTETFAVPALAMGKRLIMVYPTRSLVDDQIGRFQEMLTNLAQLRQTSCSLVVDTGAQMERLVIRPDGKVDSSQTARRHLYHGDVIITTLDKFLYRFFAFGDQRKSYTFPLRIYHGLRDPLICFDEAHAYDDVAFTNFHRLIKTLFEKGRDVALMTATMPKSYIEQFESFLDIIDFVDDAQNRRAIDQFQATLRQGKPYYPDKQLQFFDDVATDSDDALVQQIIALTETHFSIDKRLIVTAERVQDAVQIFRYFRDQRDTPNLYLYHGRLTNKQRRQVYEEIKARDKANEGYLLISTSAIEVGCDLNAHILITQLCDPEKLVQRAGRCNRRHDVEDARLIVVGDTIPEWLTHLTEEQLAKYRDELLTQNDQMFDSQAIIDHIAKQPSTDARVEMLFDMLYEYVYEARLENKKLHDNGFVITRSWEPTVTVEVEEGQFVDLPLTRCVGDFDAPLDPNFTLLKRHYDDRSHEMTYKSVGGFDCGYRVRLLAQAGFNYDFDQTEGVVKLPKLFDRWYVSGSRMVLERKEENSQSRVWFIAPSGGEIEQILQKLSPKQEKTS